MLISDAIIDNPVMLPPGLASDATRPDASGSPTTAITNGTVQFACLTPRAATVPSTTMTSGVLSTVSAISEGRRE